MARTVFVTDKVQDLCKEIAAADAVVGCMAWVTHPRILEALAANGDVKLCVRHETFLDTASPEYAWATNLRTTYASFRECSHADHKHKFFVFVKKRWYGTTYRVWIGSADCTKSAEHRCDSAIVVPSSKKLALSFLDVYSTLQKTVLG